MTDRRNQLIESHQHLVPLTRQRHCPTPPPRIEPEDLDGEGYLALCRAADRYDPARGVAFQSWAITCIYRAMQYHLRQEDWLPRGHRGRLRRTGEEAPVLVSLDEDEDEERRIEGLPDPRPGPEEVACERLEAARLWRSVERLPQEERQALLLRRVEGRSRREIAEAMGVSECQVRILEKRGAQRLRRDLGRCHR
jgi:RNA polymerase sigma factor (sigma-70 family)